MSFERALVKTCLYCKYVGRPALSTDIADGVLLLDIMDFDNVDHDSGVFVAHCKRKKKVHIQSNSIDSFCFLDISLRLYSRIVKDVLFVFVN